MYSSAEKLATFAKETNLAKLVGERTGGDGIGTDPIQIALANTGFIVIFSKEMGVTGKGSINELDRTKPHIEVDNPQIKVTIGGDGKVNINSDESIEKLIEDYKVNND